MYIHINTILFDFNLYMYLDIQDIVTLGKR
jgi:hypothetical protein